MSHNFIPIMCIVLAGGLIGCNPGSPIFVQGTLRPTLDDPARQSAPISRTLTPSLESTSPAATPSPFLSTTPKAGYPTGVNPTSTSVCNLASAGRPIDVTVPDDSQVGPGDSFVKTWRLVNLGSCEWTREYAAVWFSGMDLATSREEPLHGSVAPGESVDISVAMSAPKLPGVYQSNWKLRDNQGNLFGIGPAGNSPFWVRIEVVAPQTPVPTAPSAGQIRDSAVQRRASLVLTDGQRFDLDTGALDSGSGDDFLLSAAGDQFVWSPQNGARTAVFGGVSPSEADCRTLGLKGEPVQIGSELEGQYLCVSTDQNLTGSVLLVRVDLPGGGLNIQYQIWAKP